MKTPPAFPGQFWEIDAAGFIINGATISCIDSLHRPAIDIAIDTYRENLGASLQGVYLRGTVARGLAVSGISDLDTCAVISAGETTDDLPWAPAAEAEVLRACADLTGAQFEVWSLSDVLKIDPLNELSFALKTQAVCVFGENLDPLLPSYRPDATVAQIDVSGISNDIREAREQLSIAAMDRVRTDRWCKRIMKNIIRTGFCLTMPHDPGYTRDLGLCVEVFSRHYPTQATSMDQALQYFLQTTNSGSEIGSFLDSFGAWMIMESEAWLSRHAQPT